MIVSRRGFLKGMAGILAASQAPAILARSSIMDIYVPSEQKIAVVSSLAGLSEEEMRSAGVVDFTVTGLISRSRVTVFDSKTHEILMNEIAIDGSVSKRLAYFKKQEILVQIDKAGYQQLLLKSSINSTSPFKMVVGQVKGKVLAHAH